MECAYRGGADLLGVGCQVQPIFGAGSLYVARMLFGPSFIYGVFHSPFPLPDWDIMLVHGEFFLCPWCISTLFCVFLPVCLFVWSFFP